MDGKFNKNRWMELLIGGQEDRKFDSKTSRLKSRQEKFGIKVDRDRQMKILTENRREEKLTESLTVFSVH